MLRRVMYKGLWPTVLAAAALLAARPAVVVAPLLTNLGFVGLNRALQQDASRQRGPTVAESWFLAALARDPLNARALYGLGRIYTFQGRHARAIPLLEKATEIEPGDELMHLALGDAYDGLGQREDAIREWRRGGGDTVLIRRGRDRKEAGDLEGAAHWSEAAAQVAPESAAAHYLLGDVLRKQGMIPEAVESMKRALALAPDNPYMRSTLGLIYMSQGQREAAISEFERTVKVLPNDLWTNLYLASLYLRVDDLDKAAASARRAIALSQHPRAHFVLGTVYRRRGLTEEAIAELAEAVRLVPVWNQASPYSVAAREESTYHLALAGAYEDARQSQEAVAAYQAVLKMDPGNVEAAEALRRLGEQQQR